MDDCAAFAHRARHSRRRGLAVPILALAAAGITVGIARGDLLQWDGNGASAPNPAGGSGTWDSLNSNWYNGSAHQSYAAGTTPHDVRFGVTSGAITISGTVDASSLTFDVGGYSISGGTLNLAGSGSIVIPNAAHSATVSAVISGAKLTKLGPGQLTLSSLFPSTYSGADVLEGALAFSATGHLGDPAASVSIDGAELRMTSTSSVNSPNTRNYFVGPHGATFNIVNVTSGSNTGLTVAGAISGRGHITKSGVGTMRLDRANSTFTGGLTIADGVFRFNNNNDGGPKALRMNRIDFGSNTATLSLGGSGSSTDASAANLRSGEWHSKLGMTGSVTAATTVVGGFGASGHDLLIWALADGTFAGGVDNRIASNGGTAGINSTDGDLGVRGMATQTFTGTTNINNTVTVWQGAGLKLGGSASLTASGVNLNLRGGTFTLDNATSNSSDRFHNDGSVESRGGGSLRLIGNVAGSSETLGTLQLGSATVARSGHMTVETVHQSGASGATTITFSALEHEIGRATIDFAAANGAGATLPLGLAGTNPRITFTAAPATAAGSGLLSSTGGASGWATINGQIFAGYGSNGIGPVSTVSFSTAGASDNALLSGNETISGSGNKVVGSLKIMPGVGQNLSLSGTGNLQTPAILLAGENDYEIRNSGGGAGGITTSDTLYLHVPQAALTISTAISGNGSVVKTGEGVLAISGANTYVGGTTINRGVVRASSAGLGTGAVELRGGVLEITGGGTFSRTLGSASGEINWGTSSEDSGSGGFAARGNDVTVDLGGAGPTDLFWEAPAFVESGYQLLLGSHSATAKVTLLDNIVLNVLPEEYNAREIRVVDNPDSPNDLARISGVVSSDTAINNGVVSDLLKTGDGTLELSGDNTYLGGTIIAEGTLHIAHDSALGAGNAAYVLLGNRGGSADAALLTSGPRSVSRDITVQVGSSGAVTLGAATAHDATFTGETLIYRDLQLFAPATASVSFDGAMRNLNASEVTKIGEGTVIIAGEQHHAPGSMLTAAQGTLELSSNGGTNLTVNSNSTTRVNVSQALAALHIGGGATVTVTEPGAPKTLRTGALTIAGTLDLTRHDLIVDGGDYDSVQSAVVQGFNNGDWLGTGITSSAAANDTVGVSALGIIDNAELGYTEFSGLTDLNGDEVLVKFTYYGDADVGGTVNNDDFVQFLAGYNEGAPAKWLNGDFDYNASVNLDDFALFLAGLQDQGDPRVSPELFANLSEFVSDQDLQVDLSTVPEPSTLALCAIAGVNILRRRRGAVIG